MGILLTGVILPALMASANVQPGEAREYGDWVAGCDNALSCSAVALRPQSISGKLESLVLMRSRSEGRGMDGAPLSIRFEGVQAITDRYRITIDGQLVDTGRLDRGKQRIEVLSLDAMRLARGIAKGNAMQVEDGDGNILARFSLKGSMASLRYLDAQLGLNGTREAIVAYGRRTAISQEPSVPVIRAERIDTVGRVPETADLVELMEKSPCADLRMGVTEDRVWPLGSQNNTDSALVLLNCGSGEYHPASAVYLATSVDGGDWQFAFAPFDVRPRSIAEGGTMPLLINADWTPEQQTLYSFAKQRGAGDCGDTAAYVWDGHMFRLSGASVMPACRGAQDWITVFRTKIDFVG